MIPKSLLSAISMRSAGVHRRHAFLVSLAFLCWPALSVGAQDEPSYPQSITVATREVPPFSMKSDDGEWEGISVELIRAIVHEWELESGTEISIVFREMRLAEMLDAVEAGEVDVAAAAITVNHEREKRLDFTHAFHNTGLGIAVGASQRKAGWSGVLQAIFSPTFLRILVGLFSAMLISATAVYFFERRDNPEQFGGGAVRGVAAGIWWAAVTLTTVGYGDKVPKSALGRSLGLIWMFSGLFIIASFTAAVTTALTVNQLRSRVTGPADLSRVRVVTIEGSTSVDFLRSRHVRFTTHPDIESAMDALDRGDTDAVVYDMPVMRYDVNQRSNRNLHVLPVSFERQDYALAVASNSPLREPMNQSLLKTLNSPAWKDTLANYLGEGADQ